MVDDAQMDALVWLGPREMVQRRETVPQLAPGELLLAVRAVGICGSELSGYLGQSSLRRPPLIMGHEAAGEVAAMTEGTFADGSPARPGARVTFNPLVVCGSCDRCQSGHSNLCRRRQLLGAHRPGAFASYVAVPAGQCWPLPDELSLVAGSLAEPLACAVRSVRLSGVAAGQRLLVLGAGPIGLCCVAVARAKGVEAIIASDVAPGRLAIAEQWGARATVNARERDVAAFVQEAHPGGVDAVIDAVGTTAVRGQAVASVVPGGRVVFIGLHDEESVVPANYIIRQEVAITGCFAYTSEEFEQALGLLTSGAVRPSEDWLQERPLAQGPASFDELVAGTAPTAKIVLTL